MLIAASVTLEARFKVSAMDIRSVERLLFNDDSPVGWPGASGDSVVFADHPSVYKPKSSSGVLVIADHFGQLIGTKELSHSGLLSVLEAIIKVGPGGDKAFGIPGISAGGTRGTFTYSDSRANDGSIYSLRRFI